MSNAYQSLVDLLFASDSHDVWMRVGMDDLIYSLVEALWNSSSSGVPPRLWRDRNFSSPQRGQHHRHRPQCQTGKLSPQNVHQLARSGVCISSNMTNHDTIITEPS